MKKSYFAAYGQLFSRFFSLLFDVLFPRCCLVCNHAGEYLCSRDKKKLFAYVPCCYVCDRPTLTGSVCFDCRWSPCDWVVVGFYYTTLVKEMVHMIKYANAFEILSFFANPLYHAVFATPALFAAYRKNTLFVTYVPMHPMKEHYERWYNPSKILAEQVAKKLQLPCIQLCKKVVHTKKQSSLSKQARKANTQWVFQRDDDCFSKQKRQIEYLRSPYTVLLVDDILTTGATIDACATEIKKHLPEVSIWWLCIARNNW